MMPRFAGFRVLVTALGVLCSFPAFAGDLPQTTRKVVYDKIEGGYRFKVVQAGYGGEFPALTLLDKIVVQL